MHPLIITELHAELGIPRDYAEQCGAKIHEEAALEDLVAISASNDRPISVTRPTAAAWTALSRAAQQDAVVLRPISGFRSITRQAEIFRAKLERGVPILEILRVNAAPGFSEHHTGRALDIGTIDDAPLETSFANTPAFAWLQSHAHLYGFDLSYPIGGRHGIGYEPWHWCWSPAPTLEGLGETVRT